MRAVLFMGRVGVCRLDKLYRQLISKNQLSALEELAEESDIRKDLQKYCFEPYNWKPPAIEVEAVDDKKDAWAPIMQGLSSAEWAAPESLVAVSGEDAGKKNPTKAIADFHAYCLEPYTPAYSPAVLPLCQTVARPSLTSLVGTMQTVVCCSQGRQYSHTP